MQKSILITGASSGIGLHLAKNFSEENKFKVFAGVRTKRDEDKIKNLAIKNLVPIHIDVQNQESITKCFLSLTHEKLFGLINNAGIAIASPLEFIPIEAFQEQMDVNVTGLLRVTQASLPLLRLTQGRIINIGSVSGKVTTPLVGAYAASKHAVEAISDALRRELKSSGVRVSLIEPGMIKTPIWERSKDRAFQLLDKIPKHAQVIYQPMVDKLIKNLDSNIASAAEPEAVHRVVKHALEARVPRARYLVGRDARIAITLSHLPDAWLDKLIAKMGAAR